MLSEPELARLFGTTLGDCRPRCSSWSSKRVVSFRRSGERHLVAPASLSAPIDLTRVRSFEEQVAAKGAEIAYETLALPPPPSERRRERDLASCSRWLCTNSIACASSTASV